LRIFFGFFSSHHRGSELRAPGLHAVTESRGAGSDPGGGAGLHAVNEPRA